MARLWTKHGRKWAASTLVICRTLDLARAAFAAAVAEKPAGRFKIRSWTLRRAKVPAAAPSYGK
jgi:hypothetical protein